MFFYLFAARSDAPVPHSQTDRQVQSKPATAGGCDRGLADAKAARYSQMSPRRKDEIISAKCGDLHV